VAQFSLEDWKAPCEDLVANMREVLENSVSQALDGNEKAERYQKLLSAFLKTRAKHAVQKSADSASESTNAFIERTL
jgi:hypothetical protein